MLLIERYLSSLHFRCQYVESVPFLIDPVIQLSASGHVDYVQYNKISFFSGLSDCYEALECIDLTQYKQCRNGSTYVLPGILQLRL